MERNILGELLKRCGSGEEQAQYQLYNMYAPGMFNVALRIMGQREDAEDIVQDSFVKMFDKLESLKEPAAFTSWFKRIVVNNSINSVKKRKQVYFEEVNDRNSGMLEDEEAVADPMANYTVDGVKRAMAQLPHGYRIVLSMFLFDGFSHKQIAESLEISESTSKSQYHRAKKKIREILLAENQNHE